MTSEFLDRPVMFGPAFFIDRGGDAQFTGDAMGRVNGPIGWPRPKAFCAWAIPADRLQLCAHREPAAVYAREQSPSLHSSNFFRFALMRKHRSHFGSIWT